MSLENPRPLAVLTIDLARESDFRLGGMAVSPSAREVTCGGESQGHRTAGHAGAVALYQADGKVVSRDDLMTRCWEGRVVGEDSLNRVIWRLRKIADAQESAHFVIETIPRIGYRLRAGAPEPAASNRNVLPDIARLWLWGLLAAVIVSAGILIWTLSLADHEPDGGGSAPVQMLGALPGPTSASFKLAEAGRG